MAGAARAAGWFCRAVVVRATFRASLGRPIVTDGHDGAGAVVVWQSGVEWSVRNNEVGRRDGPSERSSPSRGRAAPVAGRFRRSRRARDDTVDDDATYMMYRHAGRIRRGETGAA